MSPYVKPYMSVRSQIELLKRRGLDIQDEQHAAYHLSGLAITGSAHTGIRSGNYRRICFTMV